jgi:hypothetical protein
MGNFLTFVKETVTIHRPMPSSFVRGKSSPLSNAPTFSIRMHDDAIEAVDAAAELLGMGRSEFMRWCSIHVAREILEQKRLYDKNELAGLT